MVERKSQASQVLSKREDIGAETRKASVTSAGLSTSRGKATTHPVRDRLRIPCTLRFVYTVAGEREGRRMLATAIID
jgi:hypothetical protein